MRTVFIIVICCVLLFACTDKPVQKKEWFEDITREELITVFQHYEYYNVAKVLDENPQTMDFEIIDNDFVPSLETCMSDDGRFKLYMLKEQLFPSSSQTAIPTEYIVQYKQGGDVYVFDSLPNMLGYEEYSPIKIYQVAENKDIYLCLFEYTYAHQSIGKLQVLLPYQIDLDNGINNVPLFKVSNEKLEKEMAWNVDICYDYTSENAQTLFDYDEKRMHECSIRYDKETKKLFVPLLTQGEHPFTDKELVYQWNGNCFVYMGVEHLK